MEMKYLVQWAVTQDSAWAVVDRTAMYADESVLRMTSVISARQAVADLTPK